MEHFGTTSAGAEVRAIRLASPDLSVTVLTLGAILQDVRLAGVAHSLTLGGPDLAAYEGPMVHFGALVGPVANRIGGARALIAGRTCRFPANEGTTLLHGGATGLHTRLWSVENTAPDFARLTLLLEDGDDGFPGNRRITAEYRVAGASLTLHLEATTDAPTLMNLANHSYWNLDGTATTDGHRLKLAADHYLPVNARTLPTGEVRPVHDVFDLRKGRILDGTEGYDNTFCLARAPRPLTEAARLTGKGGITLHFETTEPGLQVYDGRGLATAPFAGHGDIAYGPRAGLALEAQLWPDAPNHPAFPGIGLNPAERYTQTTRWSFARG